MKKLCILLFLCLSSLAQAQLPDLIPYRKGDKWGYCDSTKKIIIPVQFDKAGVFDSKGTAGVYIGNKEKFINNKGEFIDISYNYFYFNYFTPYECFPIILNKEQENERIIVEEPIEDDYLDKNKLSSDYELIGGNRNYLNVFLVRQKSTQKYGFVNSNGIVVIPCQYEDAKEFGRGVAQAKLNGKWGLIDANNANKLDYLYDQIIIDDKAAKIKLDNKWGYVNIEGLKLLIQPKYDDLKRLTNSGYLDYLQVKDNNKFGIITRTGYLKLPIIYDTLSILNLNYVNYLVIAKKEGKWGGVNLVENTELISFEYDVLRKGLWEYSNRVYRYLFEASKNGKWGIVNSSNQTVIDYDYDTLSIQSIGEDEKKTYSVFARKEGKWGVIDSKKIVLVDFNYDEIGKFDKDSYYSYIKFPTLYKVKRSNLWGVVDTSGNVILDFKYDRLVIPDGNRPIGLVQNGKGGLYDPKRKLFVTCKYDYIYYVHRNYDYVDSEPLFIVSYDGKIGYMDIYGTEYWED